MLEKPEFQSILDGDKSAETARTVGVNACKMSLHLQKLYDLFEGDSEPLKTYIRGQRCGSRVTKRPALCAGAALEDTSDL